MTVSRLGYRGWVTAINIKKFCCKFSEKRINILSRIQFFQSLCLRVMNKIEDNERIHRALQGFME